MSEIMSREAIALRAIDDVRRMLTEGLTEVPNPYPPYTSAALLWKVQFQRLLAQSGGPDIDGGA